MNINTSKKKNKLSKSLFKNKYFNIFLGVQLLNLYGLIIELQKILIARRGIV